MSKTVKALMTKELKQRYAGVQSACVVELSGLDVAAQDKLRRTLAKKSAKMEVVKNSVAKVAFQDGPLAPLGAALTGPCALVTGGDSAVEIAKLLIESAKEFVKLKLKTAIYEGEPSLLTVQSLAKMRSRIELIGEVAMLVSSPGRALAGCLRSPQAKIAGCLKTLAEKAA
jgi:large subunit ribosomal protein L10